MNYEKPHAVTDVLIAFPGNLGTLLPKKEEIPEEFWDGNNQWASMVSEWFFNGLKTVPAVKPGIVQKEALRHLLAVLRSFEPKHEHKIAGAAYLMSLWFEPEA